jgi:hypothetical protein
MNKKTFTKKPYANKFGSEFSFTEWQIRLDFNMRNNKINNGTFFNAPKYSRATKTQHEFKNNQKQRIQSFARKYQITSTQLPDQGSNCGQSGATWSVLEFRKNNHR